MDGVAERVTDAVMEMDDVTVGVRDGDWQGPGSTPVNGFTHTSVVPRVVTENSDAGSSPFN